MRIKIEINLDDESEVERFIETHSTLKGRALANRLGISGKNSSKVASMLSGYAWNKHTAILLRKQGRIETAIGYEGICNRIYERLIPKCECW